MCHVSLHNMHWTSAVNYKKNATKANLFAISKLTTTLYYANDFTLPTPSLPQYHALCGRVALPQNHALCDTVALPQYHALCGTLFGPVALPQYHGLGVCQIRFNYRISDIRI